jgi:DNA-binding transcriptional LysR family regulator
MTSILAMVRANIGVTILPEMAVWPFQPDTLVFRHLNDPTAKRQIHLLRKSETAQSPAEEMVANGIAATVRSISFDQGRSN